MVSSLSWLLKSRKIRKVENMFTLEELLFIKFYATEVNPQILAYMSQKIIVSLKASISMLWIS